MENPVTPAERARTAFPTGDADFETIPRLLARQAEHAPSAVAVAAPERAPLTYGRLWAQVQSTARRLNELGLGRGDRIAVVLPNGPEMAVAFLAVATAATCAPLNPGYRESEFDFYLSDLNARALIVPEGSDSPAIAVARSRGVAILSLSAAADAEAGVFSLAGEGLPSGGSAQEACAEDTALVLHTSGTTSRPKIVPLRHRNLCLSAASVRASLRLESDDRCLNVMPLFHIHGLVGALLSSLAAGASVVCTPGFLAPRFLRWVAEFEPTWYTAVPTMHQAVLQRAAGDPGAARRAAFRFIRSCSSPLPPQVMADLERTFGAPVIEAYGMTEAAHQMASNPLPPRARKPGSVGIAVGVELAILDADGRVLGPGERGEVVLRGQSVMDGYEANPEANRGAFAHGWFHTGDQGYLDSDGYLFLTGRLKEIINRAGEKIAPREVDEVLLDHPAVAQAISFALPDPLLGEEVAAAVVLREGASASQRELQEFALRRLADFKVPRQILFVSEIPKGPTGKPQRIGMAERLGLVAPRESAPPTAPVPAEAREGAAAPEGTAARNAVERVLVAIWEQVLEREPVGVHDDFLALGGHSLLATQIAARVYSAFQVEIPLVAFFSQPTVAELGQVLLADPDDRDRIERTAELLLELAAAEDPGRGEAIS